ncbi:hypothetical protein C8R42DRAFT_691923 [Lentinula raphanica]|nr:hypothetical protein C8R42DRAFT_691923 [Lentinula raphanica]
MLLSISSLLSARGAFTILSLSVCLLSITVIARPVDQALPVEHDLTAPPTKTYHPNILLRQFIDTKKKSTDKVAFCIAGGVGGLPEPRILANMISHYVLLIL